MQGHPHIFPIGIDWGYPNKSFEMARLCLYLTHPAESQTRSWWQCVARASVGSKFCLLHFPNKKSPILRKMFTKIWSSASPIKKDFHPMDVSENGGTPKSSNLIGFSITNHPFWGTLIFGNTPMFLLKKDFLDGERRGSLDFENSWWVDRWWDGWKRPNEHFLLLFWNSFFCCTIRVCQANSVREWFCQIPGLVATYQTMSSNWYLTHCHVVFQENRIEVINFMKVSGFKHRNFKHKLLVSVVGMWSQWLGAHCRWRLSWVK